MMDEPAGIGAALLLGLIGSTHCIGMCGGLSAALAFGIGNQVPAWRRHLLLLLLSLGRVSSYALMGAIFAGLAAGVAHTQTQGTSMLRVFAGVLLLILGMNLAGWINWLSLLESWTHRLWQPLQKLGKQLLPLDSAAKVLLAGAIWGWLPCGLIYSTLVWATTSGSAAQGALLMSVFGAGTIPAVLASGAMALKLRSLMQRRDMRIAAGLCVVAFGLWTLVVALPSPDSATHLHHHG